MIVDLRGDPIEDPRGAERKVVAGAAVVIIARRWRHETARLLDGAHGRIARRSPEFAAARQAQSEIAEYLAAQS